MFHNLLNSPCFLPPDVSIWSHQHFAVEVGVCIFITRLLCLHLYPLSIHRVHWWQRLMKWEDLGMFLCAHFTVHLTHLLEVRLRFSVSDGKGCSYSQVVYSSITLPLNAYPSQKATQQSMTLSMLVAVQVQRTSEWFLARCDLLISVGLWFALYPPTLCCSFPKTICNRTAHKPSPEEGGRWGDEMVLQVVHEPGCRQEDRGWQWKVNSCHTLEKRHEKLFTENQRF